MAFVHPSHLILCVDVCAHFLCCRFVCVLVWKAFYFVHVSLHSFAPMHFQFNLLAHFWCVHVSWLLHYAPSSFCLFHVKCRGWFASFTWLFYFFPPSALLPFKHADKFNPFFRAVCWRVWCRQKLLSYSVAQTGSVVTNLTAWLNSWGVCWLFACHLTGWLTDLWMAEWLASFHTGWHADRVTDLA